MPILISVTRHDKSGGGDMARQAADSFTLDLLSKPGRGRPRKPNALTPAQRARRYRAARKTSQGADQWKWLREAYLTLCSEGRS